MIQANDILTKIQSDFTRVAPDAVQLINDAVSKADYLDNERIIRCIVFLSDGNIDKLNQVIRAAIADPRDVMMWAENSEATPGSDLLRIRDFSREFGDEYIV